MDMYTTALATTAQSLATQSGAASSTDTMAADGISFASLLTAATGISGNTALADGANSLTWRDIQNGMMTDAMKVLQNAEKPIVTDPALAQLMNLLKQLNASGELETTGGMQQMEELLAQMQKRLQEMLEENGAIVAGQQLLAMMSEIGQMDGLELSAEAMQMMSSGDSATMLATVLSAQPGELLQTLTGQNTENAAPAAGTPMTDPLAEAAEGPKTVAFAAAEPSPKAAQSPKGDALQDTEITGLAGEAQSTEAKAATPLDFESAVRTAKQQLSDSLNIGQSENAAQPEEEQTLDIDALQQQVDDGVFLRSTPLAGTEIPEAEMLEAPEVPVETQVFDGIVANLAKGEGQFTVKLAPEELGELTIQLTKTAEGMSLAIAAKNPETQNLLATQLEALKENLKPLNVQVESVMSEEQFELLNQQRNFAGQNGQNFTGAKAAAYYGDEPLSAGEEAIAPTVQQAPATALDTHI